MEDIIETGDATLPAFEKVSFVLNDSDRLNIYNKKFLSGAG